MNNTLSVLSKVGLDIVKVVETGAPIVAEALGYGNVINPIISAFLPPTVAAKLPAVEQKVTASLQPIDDAIKAVEGLTNLGALPKDERLNTASALATSAFSDVMSLAGHDVADQALLDKSRQEFVAAMKQLTQSRVDFLNAIKPKS